MDVGETLELPDSITIKDKTFKLNEKSDKDMWFYYNGYSFVIKFKKLEYLINESEDEWNKVWPKTL